MILLAYNEKTETRANGPPPSAQTVSAFRLSIMLRLHNFDLPTGLPFSCMITLAMSSLIASSASRAWASSLARSDHGVRDQLGKACFAAATASSTSASLATGTSQRGCLLEGFTAWVRRGPVRASPLMVLLKVKKVADVAMMLAADGWRSAGWLEMAIA